jgi:hypothetical protein
MATYLELLGANENSLLNQKVRVACVIQADVVRREAPATANHANRLLWAKAVFNDPVREGTRMMWAVLAQNEAVALATILAASDATVLSAVAAAVDVFATGA